MNNSIRMNNVNKKIIELWKERGKNYTKSERGPILYPPMKKDSILFVGFNPSFNIKSVQKFLNELKIEDEPENFFKFNSEKWDDDSYIRKVVQFEEYSISKYPYFDKMKDLSKYLGFEESEFNNVDLFQIRKTNAKETVRCVGEVNKLNEFAKNNWRLLKV